MIERSRDRLFLYRLPALVLGALYVAILYFDTGQVADVLREAAPRYLSFSLTFVVPSLAVAAFHIAFIAKMTRPLRWIDPILACLPLAAMGIKITAERDSAIVSDSLPTLAILAVAIGATVLMAGWLQARAGRLVPWMFAFAAIAYLICLALTVVLPVPFPQLLRPLGVVALGLGFISVLIAALQLNKVVGLALTGVFVLCLLFDGSVHNLRRLPQPTEAAAAQQRLDLGTQFAAWLHARKDRAQYEAAGHPYPVILVSAEGGGIYAAAHTYAALTGMQRYCPGFAQHMFAATGISGGSFGLALFAATLDGKQQSELPEPCLKLDESSPAPSAKGHSLLSDKLSPVLATLLFVELADALLPGRYLLVDRAEALELAFEAASTQDGSFLGRDLRDTWKADGVTPALMFVSADLHRGSRFIMSPLEADAMDTFAEWLGANVAANVRVGTVAGASARFPWITPSGRLELGKENARLLVDGGYFEDSGSETAIDVEREIERQAHYTAACAADGRSFCTAPVVAEMGGVGCRIVIVDNFSDRADWSGCDIPVYPVIAAVALYPRAPTGVVPFPDAANSQSFFTDPLTGILAARTGRGLLALGRLSQTMCDRGGDCGAQRTFADGGYFPLMLDASLLDLPLGWNISEQRLQSIFDDAARAGHCGRFAEDPDGDQLARDRFNARRRYACQLDHLAYLVDLGRTPEVVGSD